MKKHIKQTILMSVWISKPLITVLWKHKSCICYFHFFMPAMKITLLEIILPPDVISPNPLLFAEAKKPKTKVHNDNFYCAL